MKTLLAILLISAAACASLESGGSDPGKPTAIPPTETTDPGPDVDAGVTTCPIDAAPDAAPDAGHCGPTCSCDDDCPDHEVCRYGSCHQRCSCDSQCHEHGESCHYGYCR